MAIAFCELIGVTEPLTDPDDSADSTCRGELARKLEGELMELNDSTGFSLCFGEVSARGELEFNTPLLRGDNGDEEPLARGVTLRGVSDDVDLLDSNVRGLLPLCSKLLSLLLFAALY
jgi:hypothetical protein